MMMMDWGRDKNLGNNQRHAGHSGDDERSCEKMMNMVITKTLGGL